MGEGERSWESGAANLCGRFGWAATVGFIALFGIALGNGMVLVSFRVPEAAAFATASS